jgi:hypothetical protein
MTEIAPTYNSILAIGGVSSPLDIPIAIGIVVAESFMFHIKLNGKNPAHRQSEKSLSATEQPDSPNSPSTTKNQYRKTCF